MKKIILAIMLCVSFSTSSYAQVLLVNELQDKIPKVAGFYTRAAQLYYHSLTTQDTVRLQNESTLLLKDMVHELSRPEYREAVSLMREKLHKNYTEDSVRIPDIFLYMAENGADSSKVDMNFILQESEANDTNMCFEYPKIIAVTVLTAVSNIFYTLYSLITFNLMGAVFFFYFILVSLIIAAALIVLWPLCVAGISAPTIYYSLAFIFAPFTMF
jgi:hypothetical protein